MQTAIYYTENNKPQALKLAAKLDITPIAAPNYIPGADIIVFFTHATELIVPTISTKPFSIDFAYHLEQFAEQNLKMHPLAQAIGLKNKNLTILDATAGFGKDTALISCLGHKVIALEQNPIMFAMLSSAEHELTNVQFINQDSCNYLMSIKTPYPDIIYLDPMFPSKNKHNLVKKPMQLLQAILANTPNDNDALLTTAIQKANKKVIVKRPQTATPLANLKPDITITKSQSTRYDIYLTR